MLLGENHEIYAYPTWEVVDGLLVEAPEVKRVARLTLTMSIANIRLLMGFLLAHRDYAWDQAI